MSMRLDNINLGIIGKPNSGKSTLFNTLLGEYLSPVGDEYGLTKSLYKKEFKHRKYDFVIIDTPGLRRKSKVKEKVQRSSKSKDAPSNKNSLHLKNATNGEDIPITE